MRRLLGIELAQSRAGRSRRERAHDCGRVKAALVEAPRLQRGDLRPKLIARDIGRKRLAAAGIKRPTHCQNGGHQNRARMAGKRHVVIVEHVRRDAVDKRSIGGREVAAGRNLWRTVVLRGRSEHRRYDPHRMLGRAGNHDANTIDNADTRGHPAPVRQIGRLQARNEICSLAGDIHGSPPH